MSEELLERDLQAKCVAWWNGAGLPGILFHVPNEGKRDRLKAAALAALGVKAGVPDFVLVLPGQRVAFIELKAPEGRLSPGQWAFRMDLAALIHPVYVVRSLSAFRLQVESLVRAARSVVDFREPLPLP